MCNTCSIISTCKRAARRHGRCWRRIGALACLLAALLYGAVLLHQALGVLHARVLDDATALAGPLAEAVEQQLTAGEKVDAPFATAMLSPCFADNPHLAALRVWDNALNLTGELTRRDPTSWRGGMAGRLPYLGFSAAVRAVLPRLQQSRLVETVGQLQILESEQNDLLAQLDEVRGQQPTPALRASLAGQEQPVRQLAQILAHDDAELAPSLSDLHAVLAALARHDATALSTAADAAQRVAADFTTALTDARAYTDTIAILPAAILPPTPVGGWARLAPTLSGQRALIPLFTPASNDQLVAPAGFVEVIYYLHPADALSLLDWQALPVPILLLMLALALVAFRRREAQQPKTGKATAMGA
jgi:hypothetical protein